MLTLHLAFHRVDQEKHSSNDLYKSNTWCEVKGSSDRNMRRLTKNPAFLILLLSCAPGFLCDDEDLSLVRTGAPSLPWAKRRESSTFPADIQLKAVRSERLNVFSSDESSVLHKIVDHRAWIAQKDDSWNLEPDRSISIQTIRCWYHPTIHGCQMCNARQLRKPEELSCQN